MSNLKGSISGTQSLSGGSAINVAVTPNITIGKVTTLEPNSSVIVELDESSTRMNPVLNFGIPAGKTGEKGDAGSIKFIIVNELPTEDIDESAIYMKRIESEDTQNSYEEYIYVNGVWELLGIAQVEVDLTDYIKNTDYATTTGKAGIVKLNSYRGIFRSNSVPELEIVPANNDDILAKTNKYKPITPLYLTFAVKSVVGGHTTLTQAEYDALETIDENTYYYITEE